MKEYAEYAPSVLERADSYEAATGKKQPERPSERDYMSGGQLDEQKYAKAKAEYEQAFADYNAKYNEYEKRTRAGAYASASKNFIGIMTYGHDMAERLLPEPESSARFVLLFKLPADYEKDYGEPYSREKLKDFTTDDFCRTMQIDGYKYIYDDTWRQIMTGRYARKYKDYNPVTLVTINQRNSIPDFAYGFDTEEEMLETVRGIVPQYYAVNEDGSIPLETLMNCVLFFDFGEERCATAEMLAYGVGWDDGTVYMDGFDERKPVYTKSCPSANFEKFHPYDNDNLSEKYAAMCQQ